MKPENDASVSGQGTKMNVLFICSPKPNPALALSLCSIGAEVRGLSLNMSKRIIKDIRAVEEDSEWNFGVTYNEGDLSLIHCQLDGPQDTPYEGGRFDLEFKVPKEYPLKPPLVRFDTRIYHPNISSQTGAICLDILKSAWTPVYNLKTVLISLQQLLDSPNPSDPQDAEVARVFLENNSQFKQTAQEWTKKFAAPVTAPAGPVITPEQLDRFQQMAFDIDQIQAGMKAAGISQVTNDEEFNNVLNEILQ